MNINSFNKVDNNTYNLGGVNLNYGDFIKSERAYLDKTLSTYQYNPIYADELSNRIDSLTPKELDTYSHELDSKIKYLEKSISRIDYYMDIRDQNQRNLNQLRDNYNREGHDLKLNEIVERINRPEVSSTYNQVKSSDNYSQIEGNMAVEVNGLYSCKSSIIDKKNSSN